MGEICFVVFFLLVGYFLFMWIRGRKRAAIVEMTGICSVLGYGVWHILRLLRKYLRIQLKGERLEKMRKLYVGKREEEIFYDSCGRLGCVLAAILLAGLFLLACSNLIVTEGDLLNGYFIKREGVLGQEKTVKLTAQSGKQEKEIIIDVPNRCYSQKELEKEFKRAEKYIDKKLLGTNASAEAVREPLQLVKAIPGSAVQVAWETDADGFVQEDGSIANDTLEKGRQTQITAVLTYGREKRRVVRQLTIMPRERTREEMYWQQWQKQLAESQEKSTSREYLRLPDAVQGKEVHYFQERLSIANGLLLLLPLLLVTAVLLREEKLRKRLAEREKQLKRDYPELVEQFVLLIGAGLTINGAWIRMVSEYQKRQQKRYVYEEMLLSMREIENGMSEARAYELFGKRTGLLSYVKFSTLLVQNMKKGSADLLAVLEYEVTDAFRQRKENAKVLGEEAGTKLLLPMMLMLIIVFAIILYAAFYNM